MYAQTTATGSQLKHITPIDKKYFEKKAKVIIIFETENYDTINDPDWVMP